MNATTNAPQSETAPAAAAPAAAAPSQGQAQMPAPAQQNQGAGGGGGQQGFQSASLYVGDLNRDVSEAILFETFNAVGPVASIRVCRDAVTRESLGYAYVNFHNANDAESALDMLNYKPIRGRACRIMWSQRDPSLRRSNVGNVFINNLNREINNQELYDTFEAFGSILSCKVCVDEKGESKGYGYVHFATEEGAKNAMEKVDGKEISGQIVSVTPFKRKQDRPNQDAWTNVYFKNVPLEWSDAKVQELFGKHGTITSAVLMKDDEGNSKGFGFVNFETHEAAASAVDAMNNQEFEDAGETKVIYVGRAQKRAERDRELRRKREQIKMERINKYQGVNLYVKNLDDDVDDAKLRDEFTQFGTITSTHVMRDREGASRGFGFVCFSSPDEATRAVAEMHNKLMGTKPLFVALAQRKEVRRAQLEAQYMQRAGMPRGMPMNAPMPYGNVPLYMQQGGPMPQARPGYPMMPPQMLPRAGPRGPMPGYGGRGAYPMPAYAMGMQQARRGGRRGSGGRGAGAGVRGGKQQGPQGRNFQYTNQARNFQQQQQQQAAVQSQAAAMQQQQQQAQMQAQMQQAQMQAQMQQQQMQAQAAAQAQGAVPAEQPLTAAVLAAATPAQQKNMIGERLYPLIVRTHQQLAGKITGMLLEMDNTELLLLLESGEALNEKVNEALAVLDKHNGAAEN